MIHTREWERMWYLGWTKSLTPSFLQYTMVRIKKIHIVKFCVLVWVVAHIRVSMCLEEIHVIQKHNNSFSETSYFSRYLVIFSIATSLMRLSWWRMLLNNWRNYVSFTILPLKDTSPMEFLSSSVAISFISTTFFLIFIK